MGRIPCWLLPSRKTRPQRLRAPVPGHRPVPRERHGRQRLRVATASAAVPQRRRDAMEAFLMPSAPSAAPPVHSAVGARPQVMESGAVLGSCAALGASMAFAKRSTGRPS